MEKIDKQTNYNETHRNFVKLRGASKAGSCCTCPRPAASSCRQLDDRPRRRPGLQCCPGERHTETHSSRESAAGGAGAPSPSPTTTGVMLDSWDTRCVLRCSLANAGPPKSSCPPGPTEAFLVTERSRGGRRGRRAVAHIIGGGGEDGGWRRVSCLPYMYGFARTTFSAPF